MKLLISDKNCQAPTQSQHLYLGMLISTGLLYYLHQHTGDGGVCTAVIFKKQNKIG